MATVDKPVFKYVGQQGNEITYSLTKKDKEGKDVVITFTDTDGDGFDKNDTFKLSGGEFSVFNAKEIRQAVYHSIKGKRYDAKDERTYFDPKAMNIETAKDCKDIKQETKYTLGSIMNCLPKPAAPKAHAHAPAPKSEAPASAPEAPASTTETPAADATAAKNGSAPAATTESTPPSDPSAIKDAANVTCINCDVDNVNVPAPKTSPAADKKETTASTPAPAPAPKEEPKPTQQAQQTAPAQKQTPAPQAPPVPQYSYQYPPQGGYYAQQAGPNPASLMLGALGGIGLLSMFMGGGGSIGMSFGSPLSFLFGPSFNFNFGFGQSHHFFQEPSLFAHTSFSHHGWGGHHC